MRKYNKNMSDKYSQWLDEARLFLKTEFHKEGVMQVSVNDLYTSIMDGKLPPPPKGYDKRAKRDMMMCAVFAPDYYVNTGEKVVGIKPASKGRKVTLWEYTPEDDSSVRVVSKKFSTEPLTNW